MYIYISFYIKKFLLGDIAFLLIQKKKLKCKTLHSTVNSTEFTNLQIYKKL